MNKLTFWWMKLLIKIILSKLPFGYYFWQKIGLFRHGKMDNSDYAIKVFHEHLKKSKLENNLNGIVILELGPGDSLSTALLAYKNNARAILVDAGDFAATDLTLYKKLNMKYMTPDPHINSCSALDDYLKITKAKYFTNGLSDLKKIESGSVDLIFSQAVLEHVRAKDFKETMIELNRILKDTGVMSHQVDFKDHLGGGLNNLRINSQLWEEEWFANSGFYTNRINYKKMLSFFADAKLNCEILNFKKFEKLPLSHNQLADEFKTVDVETLLVCEMDIILTKRVL